MGDNGKENGNYYSGVILGGSQNYGPFLGTLNIRCRIIMGIPKGDHNFDNHPFRVLGGTY